MIKKLAVLMCLTLFLAGCVTRIEPYITDSQALTSELTNELTNGFTSEEVVIGEGGQWPLGGTLTLPRGADADAPVPAVVIVHGSGAHNRDGYFAGNRAYYEVASYLSANGIAVLRYDKRNYVHGEALLLEYGPRFTVWEESMEDAILAADLLRADPRVDSDRIYVLGHSLGGILAPSIHTHGGDFAGLILWAGTARCMFDAIVEQFEASLIYQGAVLEELLSVLQPLAEAGDADALRVIVFEMLLHDTSDMSDEEVIGLVNMFILQQLSMFEALPAMIDSMKELSTLIPYLSPEEAQAIDTGMGGAAYYFQNARLHLAEHHIDDLTLPFLVMQGGRDFQILPDVDFVLYKELLQNHEDVTFILYDDLNHMFMLSDAANFAEHAASMMTAGRVYTPVLRDMVDWILAR